jgi:hypothetical protein
MKDTEFLRGVAGYTRADHRHNTEITKILKVFNLNITIKNYRGNWLQRL